MSVEPPVPQADEDKVEGARQSASDATSGQRSTIRNSIICLSLAAVGSGAALRVNDALLPSLANAFMVDVGTAAQVTSVFAVAYGVSQLLFGPLGERWGKYRVIAWACVACAIVSVMCATTNDFTMLRVMRGLAGACAAGIIPLSMAWIGDVVDYEDRQPVLARFLIGQIVGLSAGVWLGGFTADHWSWRVPYWMLAIYFVIIGGLLLALDRKLPISARATRRSERSALHGLVEDFRHVLEMRWARVILLSVFLEGALLYGPFTFIALHMHRQFDMSLSAAGALVMLFGLGGFVFAIGSRRLVRRLGETGLAGFGGVLLVASLLLIAFAPAWQWAIPGAGLAGLGFYMFHNTLQVNATQMAPLRRGPAVSAFASSFFLGQSAGVLICGLLVSRVGTTAIIAGGALGLLCVSAAFTRLRAKKAADSKAATQ